VRRSDQAAGLLKVLRPSDRDHDEGLAIPPASSALVVVWRWSSAPAPPSPQHIFVSDPSPPCIVWPELTGLLLMSIQYLHVDVLSHGGALLHVCSLYSQHIALDVVEIIFGLLNLVERLKEVVESMERGWAPGNLECNV
jgi:hypothetical protein